MALKLRRRHTDLACHLSSMAEAAWIRLEEAGTCCRVSRCLFLLVPSSSIRPT